MTALLLLNEYSHSSVGDYYPPWINKNYPKSVEEKKNSPRLGLDFPPLPGHLDQEALGLRHELEGDVREGPQGGAGQERVGMREGVLVLIGKVYLEGIKERKPSRENAKK